MRTMLVLGLALASVLVAATMALAGGGYGYGSQTTAAKSKTYSYRATLTAKQEVPAPKAAAKAAGVFNATVTEKGSKATIRWTLTFKRLSGKAIAAHIHTGKVGVAGPVMLPLCGPCKTGMNGRGTLTHAQSELLEDGGAYVNVHTPKNANGEIRGQLHLVGNH
jgi:CHRD domain-containing protein